jgi:nitronate monooxygenase
MWQNEITRRLNIEYPIVQAPMFGVTTPAMVAAATNVGCLGALPLGDLPSTKCVELIRATKSIAAKPFAINLFVNSLPVITNDIRKKYIDTKQFIEKFASQHDLKINLPDLDDLKLFDYHEQVDAVINEGCKIVSFTFGNLDVETIKKFKSNNMTLIGTCTSVEEAIILERSGIDMVCVQGLEAGGHRGSFVDTNIPQIGGFSLLSQVFDTVKVPVIYAGGIYNARTLLASKQLGAQGFQIGSLLLCSVESAFKEFEKRRLKDLKENDIVLTRSFSGRYARGIRNRFIEEMEDSEYILPYPIQNKLTGELRRAAKANNNSDFVSIWVGQSINNFSSKSTREILKGLIDEVERAPVIIS